MEEVKTEVEENAVEEETEKYNAEEERKDLFILQLKIVALNSQLGALEERKRALDSEANLLVNRKGQVEKERGELLEMYQPRYAKLKETLEVPEGQELNLETGEHVTVQQPPQ